MAKPLVPDRLWQIVQPLLPRRTDPRRRRDKFRRGGRPPVGDRQALTGIVYVLKTGVQWEQLPAEMGCGSGMTCWRRLRDWRRAGAWRRLHRVLMDRLNAADKIDWSRAVVDTASVRALHGGKKRAPARSTGASRAASTPCWSTAGGGCR
jgi:transposase